MSLDKLKFSRVWTSHTDFPTYEAREEVVRADMQYLFDEIRDFLNKMVDDLDAREVPFHSTDAVSADNVQDAIEDVQAQIAGTVAGAVPDNSLTGQKLVEGAVDTRELNDGAVTKPKMAEESVDHPQLCDDAVHANNILNGEITDDKLAPGALSNKADLDDGIVARSELRFRVSQKILSSVNYIFTAADIGSYLMVQNNVGEGAAMIVPSSGVFLNGAFIVVRRTSGEPITIKGANGVSLIHAGYGVAADSYELEHSAALVKLSGSNWMYIPICGKVGTNLIEDGAVTYEKARGIQKEAKVIKNIGLNSNEWLLDSATGNYSYTFVRTDSVGPFDLSRAVLKPYVDAGNSYIYNYPMAVDCVVRAVEAKDGTIKFFAKKLPSRKLWFELIVL